MAAYTFTFYALLLINGGLCVFVQINSLILKDVAFISSICHSIDTDTNELSACKHADGQTDRQMAFQLNIVRNYSLFVQDTLK